MPTSRILLASTSRYRAALLERLGLDFEAVAPGVDERAVEADGDPPRELAARLADAKAEAVAATRPESIVIGSDQVCALGTRVLHKPETEERAIAMLEALQGQTHELITAVTVRRGPECLRHTDIATLAMRPLTRPSITRYVRADRPLDCAGSYKLEARGIALFERIDCDDHSAITGLPLIALVSMLRTLGVELP